MTRGGTPKGNKRKSADAASLQKSPKDKKSAFLTPQPGKMAQKGKTPNSNKSQQKAMTPKQQNQKNSTPKQFSNKKQTPKQLTPNQQKPAANSNKKGQASNKQNGKKISLVKKTDSEESEDEEEEDDDDEIQFKDSALFKGLLNKMNDDDEDSEDDDEDDEDDDEEEDDIQPPAKKSKIAKQTKVTEVDDDEDDDEEDDEDDDEDDDEEDDEDDDESEEEEEIAPPSKKAKTVKTDAANKDTQSLKPKAQKVKPQEAPNKPVPQAIEDTSDSKSGSATLLDSADGDRMRERNAKTLFMKNLHPSVSVAQIKAFSKDIKNVRIRVRPMTNRKKQQPCYAYIEFASEALAEKNKTVLSNVVIKGHTAVVDYVGEKSAFKSNRKDGGDTAEEFDPLRLYVSGIPQDAKEADIRKVFSKATEIDLPTRRKGKKSMGYGFISFTTAQLAKQFHDKCQGADINGNRIVVLYAKKRTQAAPKQKASLKRENKEAGPQQSKKAKKEQPQVKKAEEEADDDEEDDDDEEEDDSEEDMDDQEDGGEDDDDDDEDDDDDDDDGDDDDDDDED